MRYRIGYHEGTNAYAGREFATQEALMGALRHIGSDRSLKNGGYHKTDVAMVDQDGFVVWSDRLDLNYYTGENMGGPLGFWRAMRDFYRSERGRAFAKAVQVSANKRVAYYDALVLGDFAKARALIEGGALDLNQN